MTNTGENGQSLLEVLIALAVASLVVLGLVRAGSYAIKNTRFSKDQVLASSLAQEKIAELINERNLDKEAFFSSIPSSTEVTEDDFCFLIKKIFSSLPTETPNYSEAKMCHITVDVYWDEKGAGTQCNSKNYFHNLHFDTYVTN